MENRKNVDSFYSKLKRYTYYKTIPARVSLLNFYTRIKIATAKPTRHYNLAIIDDVLPNTLSAFRAFEFAHFLKEIKNAVLFSIIDYRIGEKRFFYDYAVPNIKFFNKYKREFVSSFEVNSKKVKPFFSWTKIDANIVYIVFLNNAFRLIDYLEERNIKFILELYPGGGFEIVSSGPSYEKIQRVLGSPSLATVIATQKITYNYLIEHNFCDSRKITTMYGGILSANLFGLPDKTIKYSKNKNTLDICFTASKYMAGGLDKGYDIFIDMAHLLLKQHNFFQFHIVGSFSESEQYIDPALKSHFHFYGLLKSKEFIDFYKDKDIFIAPCRPFLLTPGGFDGFPTGTCCEAGLNGLCMILSDPLNCNVIFEEGKDVILLENDVTQFTNAVLNLLNDPEQIYTIGKNGKHALDKMHYSDQLNFRVDMINKFLQK